MSIQEKLITIVTDFLSILGISEPMVGNVLGTFLFLFGELLLLFILISFIVEVIVGYVLDKKGFVKYIKGDHVKQDVAATSCCGLIQHLKIQHLAVLLLIIT